MRLTSPFGKPLVREFPCHTLLQYAKDTGTCSQSGTVFNSIEAGTTPIIRPAFNNLSPI